MKMSFTETVIKKFSSLSREYGMLDTRSVAVGFSGGADSTVLLHLLMQYCKDHQIRLVAIHINHMIRGEQADADQQFCESFCSDHSIELVSIKKDVPALSRLLGIGIEECARKCRYEAFSDFCSQNGIDRIATAHNANDNAETVIFNLARGCSLSGICGIPPVRDNIIRPILLCTKEEIIGYAKENSLSFVFDETNNDTDYTRNFIRHRILPELKDINPAFLESVSRFSQSVRKDNAYLESVAEQYVNICDIATLSSLDSPILHRVILMKFEQTTKYRLESVHLISVARLIREGKDNSSVSLPCKMQAIIESGCLVFRLEGRFSGNTQKCSTDCGYIFDLEWGDNPISSDASVITLCSEEHCEKYNLSQQNLYKIFIQQTVDFDKINGKLYVRSKNNGDAYKFKGMTRKLKKLFNERGISQKDRATLPVICDESGIIWVPGFDPSDRVLCSKDTKNKIRIIYKKI